MILSFVRRLVLALQFLTVVTVWPRLRIEGRDLAGSVLFFPLIGLLLGAMLTCFRWLTADVFPPVLADALTVVVWVVLTRGLHMEGVADAADGLAHGIHREKALEIMKDPVSGSFAIMAVALVLLLKWAGLMSLTPGLKLTGLLIMPVAARWVMVFMMGVGRSARDTESLGRSFVEDIKAGEVLISGLSALVIGVLLMGSFGALIMVGATLWAWLATLYLNRRLGGVTGDVIGAAGELAEVGILLALAAIGV